MSVEEDFINALRFDVCHYTRVLVLGDNYYFIESWDRDDYTNHRIYFIHYYRGLPAYTIVIYIRAFNSQGEYFVTVSQKWPRYLSRDRKLSWRQYLRLLENILRLIKYSEKVVGSG